jgi:hypothetical protein
MNFVTITAENTVPTTGSDMVELHVTSSGRSISCREVGSSMSSSWGKYLFTSSYIMVRPKVFRTCIGEHVPYV